VLKEDKLGVIFLLDKWILGLPFTPLCPHSLIKIIALTKQIFAAVLLPFGTQSKNLAIFIAAFTIPF
jgi:hypothetical protein